MTLTRSRKSETIVYTAIWVLAVGLYLLGIIRHRAQLSVNLLDADIFIGLTRTILPLFILFCVNNWWLIPRLILHNRWRLYIVIVIILLAGLLCYQYFAFVNHEQFMPIGHEPPPPPDYRPIIPLPVLLDFTYGLLVIGANLAITLMFQRYEDKLLQESLQKTTAENQLTYLRAQINPHFYLNMLNNIHGMIDIDPDKAQGMLIDMSKLMRFMLYESAKQEVPLADEIAFLDNYLKLMCQRYPSDRVKVTWNFPSKEALAGKMLPPLLFITFIENAFKHGVSYRSHSYITVNIEITGSTLHFSCVNSVSLSAKEVPEESSGIGLKNIKERLKLLYGKRADLHLTEDADKYIVSLSLPIHDSPDTDN